MNFKCCGFFTDLPWILLSFSPSAFAWVVVAIPMGFCYKLIALKARFLKTFACNTEYLKSNLKHSGSKINLTFPLPPTSWACLGEVNIIQSVSRTRNGEEVSRPPCSCISHTTGRDLQDGWQPQYLPSKGPSSIPSLLNYHNHYLN